MKIDAAAPINESNENILLLQLGSGTIANEGLLALSFDEKLFLPLADTLNSLGFDLNPDNSQLVLMGSLWSPEDQFVASLKDCLIRAKGTINRTVLGSNDGECTEIFSYQNSLYASSEVLEKFFDLKIEYRSFEAKIVVLSDSVFPIQLKKRKTGILQKDLPITTSPNGSENNEQKYLAAENWGGVKGYHEYQGEYGDRYLQNYSANLQSEYQLWQNLLQFNTQNIGQSSYSLFRKWERDDHSLRPEQLELFYSSSANLGFLAAPNSGWGMRVKSKGDFSDQSFSREIRYRSFPQWSVELWKGEQLLAVEPADEQGNVVFRDLPLGMGQHHLRFVAWSLRGQRKEEFKSVQFSENLAPNQVFRYDFSALYDVQNRQQIAISMNRALNQYLGYSLKFFTGEEEAYAQNHRIGLGLHFQGKNFLFNQLLATEYGGGRLYVSDLEWSLFQNSSLKYQFLNAQNQFSAPTFGFLSFGDLELSNEHSFQLRNHILKNLQLVSDWTIRNSVTNARRNIWGERAYFKRGSLSLILSSKMDFFENQKIHSIETQLQWRTKSFRSSLTPTWVNGKMESWSLEIQNIQRKSNARWQAQLIQSIVLPATQVVLAGQYEFSQVSVNFRVSKSWEQLGSEFKNPWNFLIGVSQYFDYLPDNKIEYYGEHKTHGSSRAVFEFRNQENQPVANVGVLLNGEAVGQKSSALGELFIDGMVGETEHKIEVDAANTENPFVDSVDEFFVLKTHQGSFHRVPVLMNYFGEVEGMCLLSDGSPAPAFKISLVPKMAGSRIETRCDSQGVFLFDRVPVGIYTIEIHGDVEEAIKVHPSSHEVEVKTGGSIETGYVFEVDSNNRSTIP